MEQWTFGEAPLAEVVALAGSLREVLGLALALERPSAELERLVAEVERARHALAGQGPPDPRPRVGPEAGPDRRVYIDHSRDVGHFNPGVPEYELESAGDRGRGMVAFPVLYEGPPGLVHGGFLALFFDCVLQQLNCDLGQSGRTSALSVRYRRPTPLVTPLEVVAWRRVEERRIEGHAELRLDGAVLCEADMRAAIADRSALPSVSPRRSGGGGGDGAGEGGAGGE